MQRNHSIIGVGAGWGAQDMRTANAPEHLFSSQCPSSKQTFVQVFGQPIYNAFCHDSPLKKETPLPIPPKDARNRLKKIQDIAKRHSELIQKVLLKQHLPITIGGDHSVAIGTWAGVATALKDEDFGLIWIDAHLDANTPETSPSLCIHGMPVTILLGRGYSDLTSIYPKASAIKPQNLAIIGVRSYDAGELKLLTGLGVRIYFMEEVKIRGFNSVFEEAKRHVTKNCQGYGLSIDVDAFDPEEAPGTGVPVPDGLRVLNTLESLKNLAHDPHFLALEIAEYNPQRDQQNRTLKLMWSLLSTILGIKSHE